MAKEVIGESFSREQSGYKYPSPQLGRMAQKGAGTIFNRLQSPMFSYEDFLQQVGPPTTFTDVPQERYNVFSPELATRMRNAARAQPFQQAADLQLQNERLRPGFGSNSPFGRAQQQSLGMLASGLSLQNLLSADQAIAQANAQQGLSAQSLQSQIESQRAGELERLRAIASQLYGTQAGYYSELARALAEFTQPRPWGKRVQGSVDYAIT